MGPTITGTRRIVPGGASLTPSGQLSCVVRRRVPQDEGKLAVVALGAACNKTNYEFTCREASRKLTNRYPASAAGRSTQSQMSHRRVVWGTSGLFSDDGLRSEEQATACGRGRLHSIWQERRTKKDRHVLDHRSSMFQVELGNYADGVRRRQARMPLINPKTDHIATVEGSGTAEPKTKLSIALKVGSFGMRNSSDEIGTVEVKPKKANEPPAIDLSVAKLKISPVDRVTEKVASPPANNPP